MAFVWSSPCMLIPKGSSSKGEYIVEGVGELPLGNVLGWTPPWEKGSNN